MKKYVLLAILAMVVIFIGAQELTVDSAGDVNVKNNLNVIGGNISAGQDLTVDGHVKIAKESVPVEVNETTKETIPFRRVGVLYTFPIDNIDPRRTIEFTHFYTGRWNEFDFSSILPKDATRVKIFIQFDGSVHKDFAAIHGSTKNIVPPELNMHNVLAVIAARNTSNGLAARLGVEVEVDVVNGKFYLACQTSDTWSVRWAQVNLRGFYM